jgi:hypothetical protein
VTSVRRSEVHDWSALHIAGAPRRGNFNVLDSRVEVRGGPVLMALDADGFYHVLVPSPGMPFEADRRSAGVHLLRRTLEEPGAEGGEFADVACRKAHLSGIFLHLANDLLARISEAPEEPVSVCQRVLLRWRELLDREAPNVLSRQALAGLFGELACLQTLISINSAALEVWTGPTSSIHDFTRNGLAVEVKTSLRREGWMFEVHGHRQLEEPPQEGGELYLSVLKVEPSASGDSVPELIDEICGMGADRLDLHTMLWAVGYDARDAEVYREMPFRIAGERVYRVDAAFPRIVSSTFLGGHPPSGVLGLRYTLDLTNAPPDPLASSEWEAIARRLAARA